MSSWALKYIRRRAMVETVKGCVVSVALPAALFGVFMAFAAFYEGSVHPWAGALVGALIGGIIGSFFAVKVWRGASAAADAQRARLVEHWVDATRDPAEAQRRRKLVREGGIEAALPLVGDDVVRDMERTRLAKARVTSRRTADEGDHSAPGLAAFGLGSSEPLTNVNGQPMMGGIDAKGNPYGVSGSDETASFNAATDSWVTTGSYQPPA